VPEKEIPIPQSLFLFPLFPTPYPEAAQHVTMRCIQQASTRPIQIASPTFDKEHIHMPRKRNGPPQDSIDSILLAVCRRDTIDPSTFAHYFSRLQEEWMDGAREKVLHLLNSRDTAAQSAALHLLGELATVSDLDELEEFVADPAISDIAKLSLSPLLKQLGSEMGDEGIVEYLNDPTSAMQQMQLRLLDAIGQGEMGVEAILNDVVSMPVEKRLDFVQWLGSSNDARAAALLIPLLENQTGKMALAIIDALEILGPIAIAQTIPALNYLLANSSNRQLKQAARATLGRLTMQSVPGMEDTVMTEAQQHLPPYEAKISFVDGSGSQIMLLAWKRPDDLLKVFTLFFQDQWGIKDCYGLDEMDIKHWHELVNSMGAKSFGCFSIPFPYAKTFFTDARTLNKRTRHKLPMAYFVWRPLIESIETDEAHLPVTTTLPPHPFDEETRALALRGDELYALNEFLSWMYEPLATLRPYMLRFQEIVESASHVTRKGKGSRGGKSRLAQEVIETLLDEALGTVIDDIWRLLYESRLRRQASLLQLTAHEAESQLALAVAAMLHPNSQVPPQQQPFLRALMRVSLEQGPIRMLAEILEANDIDLENFDPSSMIFVEDKKL